MKEEKRKSIRHDAASLTVFHLAEGTAHAYARNISEEGVFVETKNTFEPGTALRIELVIDTGSATTTIHAEAEVVWCATGDPNRKQGMGLKFVSMDEQNRRNLCAAVDSLETMDTAKDGE